MAQLEFRNKFEEIFFFTKVFKFNDSSASPRTPFSFSFFHHYHHYHHNHHWLSLQLIYHPTTTLGLTTPIIISASYTTNILNQPLQLPPQTYLPKPPPQHTYQNHHHKHTYQNHHHKHTYQNHHHKHTYQNHHLHYHFQVATFTTALRSQKVVSSRRPTTLVTILATPSASTTSTQATTNEW